MPQAMAHAARFAPLTFKACLRLAAAWLLAALVILPAAAQVPATVSDLSDLTLVSGQKLPLPAGQWQVLAVYGSQNGEVAWRNTALRNQDPASSVPLLLVREAAPQQRWPQPACQQDSDNTFLVDWHDSRSNSRLSKCSRLRIAGANLAAFRTQADELPGWSRALALLPVGSLSETEDVLLAESSVLDLNGGGVRVEALLRTEGLGAPSGSLFVRDQSGLMDDQAFRVLTQWLTQVTDATANVMLVSPSARPLALDALLGVNPGTRLGERPSGPTVLDATLPRAVSQRSWALPAVVPTDKLVYVSKGSGAMGATDLLLLQDTDLIAPGEGKLVFVGGLDTWQTVLVIQHEARLYSVITSALPLNLAPGIKPGTQLSPDQLLARGGTDGLSRPSVRRQVSWHLIASAEDVAQQVAGDPLQAASAVRMLLRSPQVDTQLALGRGVLQLDLGPNVSPDSLAFRLNMLPLPVADIANVAVLLPAGRHTLEMTEGRLFKTTTQRQIDIRPAGTWLQFADYRGRDLGLFNAQFYPNDLSTTRLAWGVLDTPRQADTVTAAAPPAAPAAVPATPPVEVAAQVTTPVPTPEPTPVAVQVAEQVAPAAPTPPAAAPAVAPNPVVTTQMQQEMERLRAQLAQLQAAPGNTTATTANPALRPMPPNPRRKALVIGNNGYEHVARLDNAQTDALAIADALQTVGFQVTVGRDLSERRMKEVLRQFRQTVQGGDEVVVYFAGHGVQLANTNYLLPVDIRGQNEEEVKDESIPLQRILDDMQERRAGFMLAIIDACRDNPFRTVTRAARSRGLAPTSAATGQMIIFSAGTGQQALDKLGNNDTERNGLFTRLLLREMKKPGLSIDRIVRSVRTEVARLAKTVGHEQTPAVYDQTLGDFYFIPLASNSR
jgi:hypothetical protein